MSLHIDQYHPSTTSATKPETKKPTLILIHGGASSNNMYKDLIPYLLDLSYEIIAPDLPGHGGSSSSLKGENFTFEKSTSLLYKEIQSIKKSSHPPNTKKFVIIGISLGGQAVLDLLVHHSKIVDAAIVSGASIEPPDDHASWEMPHMPTSKEWMDLMMSDVNRMVDGMEGAQALQKESFDFTFNPQQDEVQEGSQKKWPPVLVMIGENDVAMAKRDFPSLVQKVKEVSPKSEGMVLKDSWHNHSIDIPERFAQVIDEWVGKVFQVVS